MIIIYFHFTKEKIEVQLNYLAKDHSIDKKSRIPKSIDCKPMPIIFPQIYNTQILHEKQRVEDDTLLPFETVSPKTKTFSIPLFLML